VLFFVVVKYHIFNDGKELPVIIFHFFFLFVFLMLCDGSGDDLGSHFYKKIDGNF